jgi:hypothetical protein
MSAIAELPLHVILAALLWLMAAGIIWQGVRRLAKGLSGVDHPASAVRVVRGIRGVIVAVSLAALGGGVLFASKGLLAFGVIFLSWRSHRRGTVRDRGGPSGPARGPAGRVGTETASGINIPLSDPLPKHM